MSYFDGFENADGVASRFGSAYDTPETRVQDYRVLVAIYEYEDYNGHAFLLLERDGKLFEVHGSHCSCYGLEGQFFPEETTTEALVDRIDKGGFFSFSLRRDEFVAAVINELLKFNGHEVPNSVSVC